jgi:beta-phosphoglucomutase-like phosphatase (HAD superfamily)
MCLATNAPAKSVELKTKRHPLLQLKEKGGAGGGGVFTAIVTGDMVSKGKPDPEIFLTAMKLSGITTDPKRVVVS